MIVAFVGYVGAATAGALTATYFTFLPSFIFIFMGAPFVETTHGNLKFSAPLTGITAAVVGVIVERIAVRPALKTAGSMGWVIATLGFGILLQGITSKFFGSQAIPFPEVLFTVQDVIDIGGQNISLQYASIFVVSILIIVVLEGLTRYTVLGTAIRGTAQDMELAIVQGLPVNLIVSGSFVLSSVMAGIAGILTAQISGTVDPAFGFELVLMGFVAAVLGGMGSSAGALVGGIIVGIIGKLVGGYISTAAEHGIAFALLIMMLALRPEGFFGRAEVSKA
jgi:branched-chain amino acid transport system permease protein